MGDSNVLNNSQPEQKYYYRVIRAKGTSCICKCTCGAANRDNLDTYLASLPTGFRFVPTDEELLHEYLGRKVANQPLEPNKIKPVKLYEHNPDYLLEEYKEYGGEKKEWYFFTPRERKYPRGSRPKRDAGGGYWKATGVDKPINITQDGKKIGSKKTLVYYRGKPPKGTKTNFIMNEFVLDKKLENNLSETNKKDTNHDHMRLNEWVLCRIHKKDDKSSDENKDDKASKKKDKSSKKKDDKSSKKKDEIRMQNESDSEAEAPTTEADDEYDQEPLLPPETEANGSNSTLEPTNIEANNEEESGLRLRSMDDHESALPNNFDHSNYTILMDDHDGSLLASSQVVPYHQEYPHAPQSNNQAAFFDPFPALGDPSLAPEDQIRIAYGRLHPEVENGSNFYHQQAPFSDSNGMDFYDFDGQSNFDSSQVDVKCRPDFMLVDNNFHLNSSTLNVIYQPREPAPNFQMYSTHGRDLRHGHWGHLR